MPTKTLPNNDQKVYDDEFKDIVDNFDDSGVHPTEPPLEEQERMAAADGAAPKTDTSPLSDAEQAFADQFFSPDGKHPKLLTRIKNLPARRKALAGLGIGGIFGFLLLVFVMFPTYRLPSIMGVVQAVTGEAVEEVVENRINRFIIGYLIHRADVDAVVGNSLGSTLWRTWRVHRLEDRILRETGLEWRKINGEIRIFQHDPKELGKPPGERAPPVDLGVVRSYEEAMLIIGKNPVAQKGFKKMLRIAKGGIFGGTMRKAFEARFNLRFTAPKRDPAKTDAENLAEFRTETFDAVDKQKRSIIARFSECVFGSRCDFFKSGGDRVDTSPGTDLSQPHEDSIKDGLSDLEDSSEVVEDIQTGTENGSYDSPVDLEGKTQSVIKAKMLGSAGGATAIISIAAMLTHGLEAVEENNLLQTVPATATAYMTGAQAAYYAGQADNIKAGNTPLLFIGEMNGIMRGKPGEGAEKAVAHRVVYGQDTEGSIPVEARVDNDIASPPASQETGNKCSIEIADVSACGDIETFLDLWYKAENFIGDIFGFIIDPVVEASLRFIFGDDWEERLTAFLMDWLLPFFAMNVDAFATGFRWMNQVFVGMSANMNWFCKIFLGCKAITALKPFGATLPGTDSVILAAYEQEAREELAALPLKERLFSLDEPYSLLNQMIRATPNADNPVGLVTDAIRQIGALPSKLLASVSARASAARPTPQQIADITGVRQYGYDETDLAQDISPEIFGQEDLVCPSGIDRQMEAHLCDPPSCPDIDQEHSVNLCMADREIAQALMCMYTNCPGYIGYEQPSTAQGLIANLRQVWENRQSIAFWGLW